MDHRLCPHTPLNSRGVRQAGFEFFLLPGRVHAPPRRQTCPATSAGYPVESMRGESQAVDLSRKGD